MSFHIATWEPPVPFSEIAVPNFPVDFLPPVIRDYALSVAEALQVPVDMTSVSALVAASVCVQKKFVVAGRVDWNEPINLYVMAIAPPAERKSATVSFMTNCIREYEEEMNRPNRERIDEYKTRRNILMKAIQNLETKAAKNYNPETIKDVMEKRKELAEVEVVREFRMLTTDCTTEKLVTLLAQNNEKMGIISAEGGIFDIMNGKYSGGSVSIDVFLGAHNGDPIQVDREGREGERLTHPALSILLAVQPYVLRGMMGNTAFKERGLNARFLYSYPPSKVGSRKIEPDPIDTELQHSYIEKMRELLAIPQPKQEAVIHLSAEAYQESIKFASELEPSLRGDLELISDWAGKLRGAILRIAGIMHCVQYAEASHKHEIDAQTMCNAIQIGHYFKAHAKKAFMLMGTDKVTEDARYILSLLKPRGKEDVTRSELTRLCRARITAAEMNPAIEVLIEHKYLRAKVSDSQGVGAKLTKYYINPYWLE